MSKLYKKIEEPCPRCQSKDYLRWCGNVNGWYCEACNDYHSNYEKLYTEAELQEAIKKEREACLKIFEAYDELDYYTFRELEEAIRGRE